MTDLGIDLCLVAAGAISSAVNVVAGGGSLLTLASLMALGQTASSANATVRLGILLQNIISLWLFHREGQKLDRRQATRFAAVIAIGGVLGSLLSLQIGEFAYRKIAAVVIFISGLAILSPAPPSRENRDPLPTDQLWMLAAGIYGGFLQAGVGFCLILACRGVGMDIRQSNHFKVVATLILTVPSLMVFSTQTGMAWGPAIWLSVGTVIGVPVGIKAALHLPDKPLRKIIVGLALTVAIWLWMSA
jgi:uncharacterized protein